MTAATSESTRASLWHNSRIWFGVAPTARRRATCLARRRTAVMSAPPMIATAMKATIHTSIRRTCAEAR
ncbi:hypothetical protein BJY21_000296 [Kineosphaera limosa]|nr:hypothetical protein [Kineosphaera limosa]